MLSLRPAVVKALASALGGDTLTAELVLLATISRVIGRHGEVPVGKLALNIANCPPPTAGDAASPVASRLGETLRQLLPLCDTLPLTLDSLNSASLVPIKDHEANVIWPAALQLPLGSVLLLDEAMMTPGKLVERGVKNVGALKTLADSQRLGYDFTYFR